MTQHETVLEALKIIFFTPGDNGWGVPVHLEGMPGVAKTAILAAMARSYGVPVWHLNPGQKGEGAFGVVPVPTFDEAGVPLLDFPSNRRIREMQQVGRGILFFDELNSAPRSLRPALLGTLQERVFGDEDLVPGIRMFAASNPVGIGTNAVPMSAPEANRFCHIAWGTPSQKEVIRHHVGAMAAFDRAFYESLVPRKHEYKYVGVETEKKVLDKFPRLFAETVTKMMTFAASYALVNPDSYEPGANGFLAVPNQKRTAVMSFPTPRSWSNAARLVATANILTTDSDLRETLSLLFVSGCVGEAAAAAYSSWLVREDLPDFAAWLEGNGEAPVLQAGRIDRTFMVCVGAASFVTTTASRSGSERFYNWLLSQIDEKVVAKDIAGAVFKYVVEASIAAPKESYAANGAAFNRLMKSVGKTAIAITDAMRK
jgi:hypothetical protein